MLVSPQIPPNTGNVARTCAVTGARLHLVGPLGFSLDEKRLRRAGLDYWSELSPELHRDWAEFEARELRGHGLMVFAVDVVIVVVDESESSALDDLAQHVQDIGPRIAALAEAAEAASRAALQRAAAIADELNQLVDDAEQLLTTDLGAALAEMMQEVETAAAEIRDVLDHRCPELLLQGETDFGAKMSEAEDLAKRVLAGMEYHADEVAGHAVEKLGQIVDQEMGAIEAESRTLEGELENLTALATEKTAELERAGESMTNEMRDNGADAKAAEQALEEIRARWITFGFAL